MFVLFYFKFFLSLIFFLGGRLYTFLKSHLACLICFIFLFLTLKALNAINFTSTDSFDCILFLNYFLSSFLILDLLLVLRVI